MKEKYPENLILTGMPASGKSTVGVVLAKTIGYDFVDTDLLIMRKTGRRLEEIIRDEGIDAFLEIENDVCASIDVSETVIATGGSAVYGERAMRHLKGIGCVIYLDTPFEELEKRLENIRTRGVVIREGQTLRDLYDEREALYRKYADITIQEGDGTLEQVVSRILRAEGLTG